MAVGYLGLSLWVGWREVAAAVFFAILGVLVLSLVNYLFHFLRWVRYLHLLDARLPWRINFATCFSAFALTTSDGKLGETLRSVLLKPRGVLPASLAAFLAERVSDVLVVVLLAGIGL